MFFIMLEKPDYAERMASIMDVSLPGCGTSQVA